MFYSSLETARPDQEMYNLLVGETPFWVVLWNLIEAYVFDGHFYYLGTGDWWDWSRRAWILWGCTAFPIIIWRGARMQN
jgi:hypothetical protein